MSGGSIRSKKHPNAVTLPSSGLLQCLQSTIWNRYTAAESRHMTAPAAAWCRTANCSPGMRLVTLLRDGGGRRMPILVEALLGYVPDVLVLTEHRYYGASILLREELSAARLRHQIVSHDGSRVNHLLVASRRPLPAAPDAPWASTGSAY